LASSVRFDDQWNLEALLLEAKIYYANIVVPYSRQVLKTIELASKLDIRMIAPSHGLIWRKNIPAILEAYTAWASGKCVPKIVVLFDTMWESTAMLADAILAGAATISQEVNVQFLQARRNSLAHSAAELLDASSVAFGSATLNGQVMPSMVAAMTYVKGLFRHMKKSAFAFGSSGWGIGATEQISKWFEEIQWEQVCPKVRSQWRPNAENRQSCFEAGRLLAQKAMNL
jgi:flavorubredoxin